MGKVRKKGPSFQYTKNRKRAWKNSKKLPNIECAQIKQAWDEKKSMAQNMKDMGLSIDANKTLKIPHAKDLLGKKKTETMSLAEARAIAEKQHVVMELEEEASLPEKKGMRMSQPEVEFCTSMIKKYGEEYKKMARDSKNYYQLTPKQIRKKIKTFMSIPDQYNEFLNSQEGTMDQ